MFKGVSKRNKNSAQLSQPLSVQSGVELDHLLMLKIKDGDQKAFKELFNKYKGPIMNYINTMVGIKSLSEEITQEVFLRVYRFKDTYSPTAKFTTWLWTIARNASIDHLRSSPESSQITLDDIEIQKLESPLSNAEVLLIQNADVEKIHSCMDRLPASQKEILTMHIFGELSYDQMADVAGQTVSAIKSVLFRARQALLVCIQKNGTGHGK